MAQAKKKYILLYVRRPVSPVAGLDYERLVPNADGWTAVPHRSGPLDTGVYRTVVYNDDQPTAAGGDVTNPPVETPPKAKANAANDALHVDGINAERVNAFANGGQEGK